MKKLKLFLLMLLLASSEMGVCQIPHFQNIYCVPAMPSINDSIQIIDSVSTGSPSDYRSSYSLSIRNDTILLTNCYKDSTGWDIVGWLRDTTPIGLLPVGTYHCFVYSKLHLAGIDTSYDCSLLSNRDSTTFSFTVSEYATCIVDIDVNTVTLSPNPAKDRLMFDNPIPDIDIVVFDMSGRDFTVPHSQHDIDISSLSAGVYCVRIQSKDGSTVKRFVKQ